MARPKHPEPLTPAEQRVLAHVREGLTNVEIAVRLGLSVNTVKYHVANLLAKTGARDRAGLPAPEDIHRTTGAWRSRSLVPVAIFAAGMLAAAGIVAASKWWPTPDDPAPLPTGSIAYVVARDGMSEIQTLTFDAVGAVKPSPVGLYALDELVLSPVWSPDGSALAYFTAPFASLPLRSGIFNSDGGQETLGSVGSLSVVEITTGATVRTDGVSLRPVPAVLEAPGWRHDGGVIAFVIDDFITRVADRDLTDPRDQMLGSLTPHWGPDGLIASAYFAPGSSKQIVVGRDSGEFRYERPPGQRAERWYPRTPGGRFGRPAIAPDPGSDVAPVISADGRWIAWERVDALGRHVMLSPLPPTGADAVRDLGPGTQPRWSPTSPTLVFATSRPAWFLEVTGLDDPASPSLITVYDAAADSARTLTAGPGDFAPVWSPDGAWIAFVSTRDSADGDIYLVRPSGKDLQRLTTIAGGRVAQIAWGPVRPPGTP